MFWFDDMLVCFNCGVFCFECRSELFKDLLMEMFIVYVFMDFDEIYADVDNSKEILLLSFNVFENELSEVTIRMILRSFRKN